MNVRCTAAFALLATGSCTLPNQNPPQDLLPLCVAGFRPGQTLKARLGAVYDASSDYVYDANFVRFSGPSCNGIDGLTTDSVVTLVPQKELSIEDVSSYGFDCAPLGQFASASLENSDIITPMLWVAKGITIGGAFGETTIRGASAYRSVGLFTPAKNASGTLTPRELPPLAVSRIIYTRDFMAECSDTWVATWAP
jgi:hypothetical protein